MKLFKDYQQWTKTKSQKDMTPYDFATNMGVGLTEASEVTNEYKKVIFHHHPFPRAKIVKEFGDMMFYMSEIANIFQIDLDELWEAIKCYTEVNMYGVETKLTDRDNLTLDELTSLNKSVADMLAVIRDRHMWSSRGLKTILANRVRVFLYSILESQKTIFHLWSISIEEVLETNIKKLNTRYPDGFSAEASIARVDTEGVDFCEMTVALVIDFLNRGKIKQSDLTND